MADSVVSTLDEIDSHRLSRYPVWRQPEVGEMIGLAR